MKKRLFLVVNAKSGTAAVKNSLLDVIDVFSLWEYDVTVHITRGKDDASRQIRGRAKEFDLVVCCGGDGTANEAFEALSSLENPPPLGLIPTGTTNDFAYSLSMPSNAVDAAQAICGGKPFLSDCGLFNGRIFTYAAAFGVFTDVPYATPQESKNLFGRAAYVLEAIKNLPSYAPYSLSIECEEGSFEGDYILGMITNTVSVGGFRNIFQSVAALDDGRLEVTLIKMPKVFADFQKIIAVLLGGESVEHTKSDFLTVVSTGEARIKSEKGIYWTLDGEEGGAHGEALIKVLPKSVPVIIPGELAARLTI